MYGFHLKVDKISTDNILDTLKQLKKYNCQIVQIFSENYKIIEPILNANFNEYFKLIFHMPFIINLSEFFSPKNFNTRKLIEDIKYALNNNVIGYVVHVGVIRSSKNMTSQQAIRNMYNLLTYVCKELKLHANKNFTLYLEPLSGKSNDILYKLKDLSIFCNILHKNKYTKQIKLCMDTCHIFASGYDLRTKKKINNYLLQFNKLIGLHKIGLIHLNDSKYELNSREDQHKDIGDGYIGATGLKYIFYVFNNKFHINIILETPTIENNLKKLQIK